MGQEGRLHAQRRGYAQAQGDAPARRRSPVSIPVACGLLIPLDALAVILSAIVAYAVWLDDDPYAAWAQYEFGTAFATLLALNVFHFAGLYRVDVLRRPWAAVKRMTLAWMVVAALLMALSFLTKTTEDYSRAWAILWFAGSLVGLVGIRAAFFARTRRWAEQGRLRNKVALIGSGPFAERLAASFAADPKAGIQVVGVFSDREPEGGFAYDHRVDGSLTDLVTRARRDEIDSAIVAIPGIPEERFLQICDDLSEVPVDVRYCPGPVAMRLAHRGVTHFAGVPAINVMDRPLSDWRYAIKELEDRTLAAAILLLIAPLLLAIAIAIKLDSPGPVFFRQRRYGYNNQLIDVLKFRTMRHDLTDDRAEQLTRRNDPRLTRLGAFLRRWSLDELPQFINVLRGEMSIVGPRPHALAAKAGGVLYHEAVDHYAARHRVKPGITGWAQINGWRGNTETVQHIRKRVEHDIYYIENWSLWLDLKIIVLTTFKGFRSENSY